MALIAEIYKRQSRWVFHVIDYNENIDAPADEDWTDCIEWTVKQLASQPRVKRMAYDMWYFERKHEAEKFQTLWLLRFSA